MSDQNKPVYNDGHKPGGNTGSVHGEVPLIRKKEDLTPEQYKRQRNNLIFSGFLTYRCLTRAHLLHPLPEGLSAGWRRVPRPGLGGVPAAVLRISQ